MSPKFEVTNPKMPNCGTFFTSLKNTFFWGGGGLYAHLTHSYIQHCECRSFTQTSVSIVYIGNSPVHSESPCFKTVIMEHLPSTSFISAVFEL